MALHTILRPEQCGSVARSLLTLDRQSVGGDLWNFGFDTHGAFITNQAFLAYMSLDEQSTIMVKWGLLPGFGTWNPWSNRDATDSSPVPNPDDVVDTFTTDDPPAEDTAIEWHDNLNTSARLYLAGNELVPIDSRYHSLLAGRTIRMHGPVDKAVLWAAAEGRDVAVAVMRLRDSALSPVIPKLAAIRRAFEDRRSPGDEQKRDC